MKIDPRELYITAQVVYKELSESLRQGKIAQPIIFEQMLEQHLNKLFDLLETRAVKLANVETEQAKKSEVPFESKPANKWPEKVVGATCTQCNAAPYVKNPKTGKVYCSQKCWL